MNLEKSKKFDLIFLILGLLIVIAGLVLGKVTNWDNARFLTSGLGGIGGAFLVLSGRSLYKIKNQPEKYEEEMAAKYDERNELIRAYAGYHTFILTLCTVGISSIILLALGHFWPAVVALGVFAIQIVGFWIFLKYYNKIL